MILLILLILSNFLLKMRIHSYFCRILTFAFLRFFFDQTGRFFGQRRRLYENLDSLLRNSEINELSAGAFQSSFWSD